MDQFESERAAERIARLKSEFDVTVLVDGGHEVYAGELNWQQETWSLAELDRLHDSLALVANEMGGNLRFVQNLGSVTVKKANIGSHGGEALQGQVTFSNKGSFSAWTVVHEFAHIWDEKNGWGLSRQLERYTGGFTSPTLSRLKMFFGLSDSAYRRSENLPGRRGRKPGCNAAGYFYGDKPSGSNWAFNRVEDFAESVSMYVGWGKDNALSEHARKRIIRYLRQNGEKDDLFGIPDHWADYKKYFYPEGGDYTKTKRWKFIEALMRQ